MLDASVVEGHVPALVVARLLEEPLDIDCVTSPGMPAGSLDMGGSKTEPFTVTVLGEGPHGDVYAVV